MTTAVHDEAVCTICWFQREVQFALEEGLEGELRTGITTYFPFEWPTVEAVMTLPVDGHTFMAGNLGEGFMEDLSETAQFIAAWRGGGVNMPPAPGLTEDEARRSLIMMSQDNGNDPPTLGEEGDRVVEFAAVLRAHREQHGTGQIELRCVEALTLYGGMMTTCAGLLRAHGGEPLLRAQIIGVLEQLADASMEANEPTD